MSKKPLHKVKSFLVLMFCTVVALVSGQAKAEDGAESIETGAKASVLIESNTGTVLLKENENQAMPMASTTKVMTALMAMEYGKLDEMVTVSRNAFGVPGTSIYLSQGEKISLRHLVYGLMLASGNDAAVAIAEHIDGSVSAFCKHMTQRARELGCEKTVFVNPNGLPAQGHQTTAYELALIAREAMNYPEFRAIVSTERASIPWEGRSYDRILNNKNRLLREYEGAIGIKTGYTKAAGRCLVFGARRDGLEVIGVVLNCGDWFEEAKRIMDKGFATYEAFTAFGEGEMVRALPVSGGQQDTVAIYAQGGLLAPVHKGRKADLELDLPDSLPAGMACGTIVGEARLLLGNQIIAKAPLVVGEMVARQDYGFVLDRMLRQWVGHQSVAQ